MEQLSNLSALAAGLGAAPANSAAGSGAPLAAPSLTTISPGDSPHAPHPDLLSPHPCPPDPLAPHSSLPDLAADLVPEPMPHASTSSEAASLITKQVMELEQAALRQQQLLQQQTAVYDPAASGLGGEGDGSFPSSLGSSRPVSRSWQMRPGGGGAWLDPGSKPGVFTVRDRAGSGGMETAALQQQLLLLPGQGAGGAGGRFSYSPPGSPPQGASRLVAYGGELLPPVLVDSIDRPLTAQMQLLAQLQRGQVCVCVGGGAEAAARTAAERPGVCVWGGGSGSSVCAVCCVVCGLCMCVGGAGASTAGDTVCVYVNIWRCPLHFSNPTLLPPPHYRLAPPVSNASSARASCWVSPCLSPSSSHPPPPSPCPPALPWHAASAAWGAAGWSAGQPALTQAGRHLLSQLKMGQARRSQVGSSRGRGVEVTGRQ